MARRKKKSKSNFQKPSSTEPVLKVKKIAEQDEPESQPAMETPAKAAPARPGKQQAGISMATCLGGMFLTLVLGIYLGTLLPDLMRKMTATPGAGGVPEPAGQSAPAPVAMDEELRHLVGDLEKKAAANPDSAPDWINLGNIYFDSQQPEKAISAYERALSLAPKNADVLTDLGIMYRETGQYEKSIDCFRKAIAINPRHENAMYNEGVVLLNDLHKKTDAADAWQRLLDINPRARSPQGKPLKELIGELR